MNTRQTILTAVGILVIVVVGAWWYLGFTLDFMRFFAAEPGTQEGPGDGVEATCVPRPPCMDDDPPCMPDLAPGAVLCPPSGGMVACSPEQQTVAVGEMANLSATGGSGEYEWFAPEGTLPGGTYEGRDGWIRSTIDLVYGASGIKKVTVQSPRGDGLGNVDSVACTVIVTEARN